MEAHARDEWPLGHKRSILDQHRTVEDRINAAKLLLSEDQHCTFTSNPHYKKRIPVVIDNMQNSFNTAYAVWPERLYILQGEVVKYISMPNNPYLHETAKTFLTELFDKNDKKCTVM